MSTKEERRKRKLNHLCDCGQRATHVCSSGSRCEGCRRIEEKPNRRLTTVTESERARIDKYYHFAQTGVTV